MHRAAALVRQGVLCLCLPTQNKTSYPIHRKLSLTSCRPLSHVQARYFAAAAAASQQVSSFSTLDMQPAEGRLVEYKRNMRTGLALLLHPDGKQNWSAIDTRCAAQTAHCQCGAGCVTASVSQWLTWTAQHSACRIRQAFPLLQRLPSHRVASPGTVLARHLHSSSAAVSAAPGRTPSR